MRGRDEDEERDLGTLEDRSRDNEASQAEVRGKRRSMSQQFGFNFDQQEMERELTGPEITEKAFEEVTQKELYEIGQEIGVELAEPPEQSEPEQPALFEGFAPVSKKEPEIPWTQYVRMVQIFFDGPKFEEFRDQVSKLAVQYGTKNLTDTVAEAVRREAH